MSDKRRILIAVDGSSPAQYAFEFYLTNIQRAGDCPYVVTCSEYSPNVLIPGNAVKFEEVCQEAKQHQDKVQTLLDQFTDQLRAKGIPFEARLLSNEKKPGEAIVKFAEDNKMDMIIMGTRGQGKVRRTLMGSVSDFVVHHSHIPVIVARKD